MDSIAKCAKSNETEHRTIGRDSTEAKAGNAHMMARDGGAILRGEAVIHREETTTEVADVCNNDQ